MRFFGTVKGHVAQHGQRGHLAPAVIGEGANGNRPGLAGIADVHDPTAPTQGQVAPGGQQATRQVRQGLAQDHHLGIVRPVARQTEHALAGFVARLAGVPLVDQQGHVLLDQALEFVDEPVGVRAEFEVADELPPQVPGLNVTQGEGGQGAQLHAAHRLAGGDGIEQGAALQQIAPLRRVVRAQQHLALRVNEVAVRDPVRLTELCEAIAGEGLQANHVTLLHGLRELTVFGQGGGQQAQSPQLLLTQVLPHGGGVLGRGLGATHLDAVQIARDAKQEQQEHDHEGNGRRTQHLQDQAHRLGAGRWARGACGDGHADGARQTPGGFTHDAPQCHTRTEIQTNQTARSTPWMCPRLSREPPRRGGS